MSELLKILFDQQQHQDQQLKINEVALDLVKFSALSDLVVFTCCMICIFVLLREIKKLKKTK